MGKVFVIDPSLCNGCHCCQVVCKDEHCEQAWMPYADAQPETGHFWRKVTERVRGSVPKVEICYVTHGCMHCDSCALMEIAPEAVYKREDGLVLIDPEKAKGMKELVDACPYHAVYWNDKLGIAQKCTGCAHLLDDGWDRPRCADSCPSGALRFGDEEGFAEEIASGEVLLPELGTKPRTYYVNLPKRFIGGCVYDPEAEEVLIGASITIQNNETQDVMVSETDEFGDFWFRQIEPGVYTIWYQIEGYMMRTDTVDVTEKDVNVGDVALYVA